MNNLNTVIAAYGCWNGPYEKNKCDSNNDIYNEKKNF